MSNRYTKWLLALVALQTVYFSPMIVQRHVVFPHNNAFEVSGRLVEDADAISNRKFSDVSNQFIPELNQHLNGNNQAWLATWNPHVELGRPVFQLAGQGKAYLLTHILSLFTSSPFILYTWLILLTIYLTGLFCFLFLKALDLHPVACFSIAAGLSLGTFSAYWFTFFLVPATLCWALALFWLLTVYIKHKSIAIAAGIGFASYSLLMTGFPQVILLYAYLIGGFFLIRLWKSSHSYKTKLYIGLTVVGAVLVGAISALPAYLDMLTFAQRSVRFNIDDEFFLSGLPSIKSFNELSVYLGQLFDAFWFGSVIKPDYPFDFNGLCLTTFYFSLFSLSFGAGLRQRLWPWQLWVGACLLATLWSPAYLFMVHYLGFNLSLSIPLGGAIIPAFVLAGYALDRILRERFKPSLFTVAVLIVPVLFFGVVALNQRPKLHIPFVALCLVLTSATALFVKTRQPMLSILLTLASVGAYGLPILLTRPMSQIRTSSSLIDWIRKETADGSRYALIGQDLNGILPPNQESLWQIKSVHSYDSLASSNYRRLMEQLGGVDSTYRRYFTSIAFDKVGQSAFTYAGVSLLLTGSNLDTTDFKEIGEINAIKLYKSVTPPTQAAQLSQFTVNEAGGVVLAGSLSEQATLYTKKIFAQDDFLQFQVTPSDRQTLFFVSQQSHPYWQATSKKVPLSMVIVNDFYLGVLIPPYTNEVEMRFTPFVLWSWIPQVFFIALGCAWLVGKLWIVLRGRSPVATRSPRSLRHF